MPVQLTHQELWNQCLSLIRQAVGDAAFDRWFSDARCVAYDTDQRRITIYVPSAYIRDLYESRYHGPIVQALTATYGTGLQVYWRIPVVEGDDDASLTLPGVTKQEPPPASPSDNDNPLLTQLNPSYTFENFCVGDSNRLPYTIAKAIADHPDKTDFNPFVIYGPVGVGKTHLMQAIGHRLRQTVAGVKVVYVSVRTFINQYQYAKIHNNIPDFLYFYQQVDTLLIDDLQELSGKKGTIEALFSIFSYLHNAGKKLVFTSDRPPGQLVYITDRLIDRFKWGSTEMLPKPDVALRRKILVSKAQAGGLELPEDVVDVIATRVDSSVRELEGVVAALITRAIFLSAPIDRELAIQVMNSTFRPKVKQINFDMIVELCAEQFSISPDVIFSPCRVRDIADARQVIMYLAQKHLSLSTTAIGLKLGRKHCTVLHGIKTIRERMEVDMDLRQRIEEIEKDLLSV